MPLSEFLTPQTVAVAGVSRSGRKMGNLIFDALRARGYRVVPVNPAAEQIAGERCYPDIRSIPVPVDAVVTAVRPAETARIVREALAAGVRRIWLNRGSVSDEAVQLCKDGGVAFVRGECLLMYAVPVRGIHGVHRTMRRVFGKLSA
jgi:uncharacterized protein